MKTKIVMIERRVTRDAATVLWETIQASITYRSTIPAAELEGLNQHIRHLRATHKALKAASKEGTQ